MTKSIIVEPNAERDIAEAFDWYEQQRPGLGDDFALCVEAGLHVIAQHPRSFPVVRKPARRMLIQRFPYLILFVDRRDVIAVIGVFHTSRDPKRWNERLRK
jgi:plasmid stabilization system protein ParE